MSEFSMNIVTRAGAALIAQATAANPIVIVSGVSREDAATDASDLADKTAAWYTGKGGRVAAVSAAGGVARIVIAWGHEGVAQPAKSLAVLARLESQSVSQSVVLCAMSDPGSTVVLPGADDTAQAVEVPFNIAIDPTADIQVTPGSAASLSDLDRFVSCHAPGNPTGPENQAIWGWKVFRTLSAADARIENGLVSGTLDFGGNPDNPAIARTKISRSKSDALELANGGYSVSLTSNGSIDFSDSASGISFGHHSSGYTVGDLICTASEEDSAGNIHLYGLNGGEIEIYIAEAATHAVAQDDSSTGVNCPVGSVAFVYLAKNIKARGVSVEIGETFSVSATGASVAELTSGGFSTGARYLPAGTYKAFCKITFTGEAAFFDQPIFVQRVG